MLYYVWKVLSTTLIAVAGAAVTIYSDTFAMKMAGAFLIGLFWQQCGWLAHDFAHNQVFKNRRINDLVVLMVGNLYQGFSVAWWKNKHNTHHAIPNLHESHEDAHDGDPDIDTLPFLAWSSKLIQKTLNGHSADSGMARFMTRHQALLYFPILFFARITWALQSFFYVFDINTFYFTSTSGAASTNSNLHYPIAERLLLIAHYTWYACLTFIPNDPLTALAYLFVSNTTCGVLLAVAFGVGHNGMTVYDADKKPGFAELQVTTTRNVHDNPLVGWFMGGLHYQIEHHLFPTVPRHNLRYVRQYVEPLCKKHKVPYHCTGLAEGTWEIIEHLKGVTDSLAEFPAM
jgi:fatty acid desaturase